MCPKCVIEHAEYEKSGSIVKLMFVVQEAHAKGSEIKNHLEKLLRDYRGDSKYRRTAKHLYQHAVDRKMQILIRSKTRLIQAINDHYAEIEQQINNDGKLILKKFPLVKGD